MAELNAAISNHKYGYSEVSDKPGPLRDSVFHGDQLYKLKYKASQTRLFLRLLPFMLSSILKSTDGWYFLIAELIEICQINFSPVISLCTINLLQWKIGAYLQNFKKHNPEINITPKQHYLIHLPTIIKDDEVVLFDIHALHFNPHTITSKR